MLEPSRPTDRRAARRWSFALPTANRMTHNERPRLYGRRLPEGSNQKWPIFRRIVAIPQAQRPSPPEPRTPNPDARPPQAPAPPQVWFADRRALVKIDGQWLSSLLSFDGYRRAMVGAGCFERQTFSRVVQVFREAIARWGAPERLVSDH